MRYNTYCQAMLRHPTSSLLPSSLHIPIIRSNPFTLPSSLLPPSLYSTCSPPPHLPFYNPYPLINSHIALSFLILPPLPLYPYTLPLSRPPSTPVVVTSRCWGTIEKITTFFAACFYLCLRRFTQHHTIPHYNTLDHITPHHTIPYHTTLAYSTLRQILDFFHYHVHCFCDSVTCRINNDIHIFR